MMGIVRGLGTANHAAQRADEIEVPAGAVADRAIRKLQGPSFFPVIRVDRTERILSGCKHHARPIRAVLVIAAATVGQQVHAAPTPAPVGCPAERNERDADEHSLLVGIFVHDPRRPDHGLDRRVQMLGV